MSNTKWGWLTIGLWAMAVALWLSWSPSLLSNGDSAVASAADSKHIVINVLDRRLTLYQGNTVLATYPVAVGKPNTTSPRGEFVITQKAVWGDGFGTRWMRISVPWGIYGIHGTNKPWTVGTVASHGCFRMFNRDVEKLYEQISVGTSVTIEGATPMVKIRRPLHTGQLGQDVVELQRMLRLAKVYSGRLDGIYSDNVADSVKKFQSIVGITPTGVADMATLTRLAEYTQQAGLTPRYLSS